MLEFAYKYLENVIYYREELYTALGETIIMVFIAGIISTLIGIILGIALAVTKKNGILENTFINTTLARIINILRSIPFVILLAASITPESTLDRADSICLAINGADPKIKGTSIGNLIVKFEGSEEKVSNAINYLNQNNIDTEVLKNVGICI